MGGVALSSPVESTVIERVQSNGFSAGVAEMNGFRPKMEDAHIIYCQKGWAFFGVFDGHGGDKCSKFVADLIKVKLDAMGCPEDGPALRELILDVDKEFLSIGEESGSTAAMCIVHTPPTPDGKYKLRTANAGDSRVLLGRLDGSIVDGGGTDQGLTVDHKPDNLIERTRIERLGGTVDQVGPCARVNGELAVSRAFGDAAYKRPGPKPEDCLVIADPDLETFECDKADFLIIVCDGVSEGDFPNPEVVKLVAERLEAGDEPAAAAEAVVFKALETKSKDNITCMIVRFTDLDTEMREVVLHPGPMAEPGDQNFVKAYEAMAQKAGVLLRDAVELRYKQLAEEYESAPEARKDALREELEDKIGRPPGKPGDAEWISFFDDWEARAAATQSTNGPRTEFLQQMLSSGVLQANEGLNAEVKVKRKVRAPDLDTLRTAVEAHSALQWNPKMTDLANEELEVLQDDLDDGTSKLRYLPGSLTCWLPSDILEAVDTK